MNESAACRPWYRERMVWMLICIPLSAVVMGVIMITLAVRTWDGLVVDDYYKHGKEINRVLDRDHRASKLGLSANLVMDLALQKVSVGVSAENGDPGTGPVTLRMLHPTQAGFDFETQLALGPDGRYHGVTKALRESDWIVQLDTSNWRLNKRIRVQGNSVEANLQALAPDN